VAATAAALAACGSSAKDDGGGAKAAAGGQGTNCDAAQQAIAKATEPLQLTLPSEPVPMDKLQGKSVWYIAPDMSLPFIAAIAQGFKDAAEAAGLKPTIFDGKGNVNTFNQGVSSAVSQGADGILLQGINPALVSGPLQQATKQKIAIVDSLNGGPDQPLTGGVQAHVTVDYKLGGALMADYTATSTDCKGQAIFFTSSIYNIYKDMVAGFKEELARVCPDCKLADVVNVAPTDLATKLGGLTSTAAARHPDVKAFVAAYDGQVQFMEQALQERGGDGLAIISHDGVTSNLKQIQAGAGLQTMDVSNPPNEAMGWAEVDQLGRLLAKLEPVQDALPQQVFVKDNISGDPEDVAALFPGYADYQSQWKKLWGVG
jgi:ABC-type sugar transport system substrate-binding protein